MNEQYSTHQRSLQEAKILLIEDSSDDFLIIRQVLSDCMPKVTLIVATTAEEALNQLRQNSQAEKRIFRLILLDLYLPKRTNGIDLLRQIKGSTSPYRLIPVAVLSHSELPEDVRMSYDLGTNSYIVKPVSYDQWRAYFQSLRQYWWNTVTLPLP